MTNLTEKWKVILEDESLPKIKDELRRNTTAIVLENTEKALKTGETDSFTSLFEAAPATNTGNVQNYDPVLISMIRRSMPNLIAYDLVGVQAMTGPSQLIFAMRARYTNSTGTEAFYNEADTTFSGTGTEGLDTGVDPGVDAGTGQQITPSAATGTAMPTATMEANTALNEMTFTIEKISVTAQSRGLKAEYTTEIAQDLRAIHGLDAEKELAQILSAELLAEINREMVRTVYTVAVTGSQQAGLTAPGFFDMDLDSDGRWSDERFKGLHIQIQREANVVAKTTRRGKGNVMLCSSDVAVALQSAGKLTYTPEMKANLNIDDTGNTFAGVLPGGIKVYIDPYAGGDYFVLGYKGASPWDAGIFYCPYVPLQMHRAVGENSFQPKIAFKTRYGMVANPFAEGATAGAGALNANSNLYYRRTLVKNIM